MTQKSTRTDPGGEDPRKDSLRQERRPGLRDWLRAWREVARDPDKQMPVPPLPGEGIPLPESLDLHCPECDYNLTGLREWRCPECGERFSPRRAYTLRMLKTPEFFLRYRYDPAEIRSAVRAVMLFLGGVLMALLGGPKAALIGGTLLLIFFAVIVLPNMILLRWQAGLSWPRFLFWMSLLWFLGATLLCWLAWK